MTTESLREAEEHRKEGVFLLAEVCQRLLTQLVKRETRIEELEAQVKWLGEQLDMANAAVDEAQAHA